MDVKSIISCDTLHNSSDFIKMFKEPPSFLKALVEDKCGSFGANATGRQDALEAVKLDPAVLEAQVTVHTRDKAGAATNSNRSRNIVTEKTKDPSPLSPTLTPAPTPSPKSFKDMVLQHETALLSLTPHQLELLMTYADILRRQRMITQKYLECAFCKNNGKPSFWYSSHALRDGRGRVRCPILRGFRCPRCGATGDQAHTIKYCPENALIDTQSSSSSGNSLL